MARWKWILSQLTKRLWVRASLIGSIGILAAILAAVVERFIPWDIPGDIGTDAVDSILNILATSMLTVTTFSLSTMVAAYSAATSSVTPRATKLLIEDRVTQIVLSTFLGSFLFSVVGIVVLKTGAYGSKGRVILFVVTVGVIVLIVGTLLRWIDHLTTLGRVGETTNRVEEATRSAILERKANLYLGGSPLIDPERDIPENAVPVSADTIGYVQFIDIPALAGFCEEHGAEVYLTVNPGALVYNQTAILSVAWKNEAPEDEERRWLDTIRNAVSIGTERSFSQDPRFGLVVMSEIACRAISPAVNDSGTALDVIGRSTRLLSLWAQENADDDQNPKEPTYPQVHVMPLKPKDLFEDAFMLIARDGAGLVEIQLRLQKSLNALSAMGDESFRAAARQQARLALERSDLALNLEADRERLRNDT